MQKYKKILFILSVFLLNGCTSLHQVGIGEYSTDHVVRNDRVYMSCDVDHYRNYKGRGIPAFPEDHNLVAEKYFIYALMASNAYKDNAVFEIEDWERVKRYESRKGFGADIYVNDRNKILTIAYRGTNWYEPQDWFFGNLNIYWKGQYEEAEQLVDMIYAEFSGYKIVATGHSLGGGLALHTSLYANGVDAIVFNSSPRVFKGKSYLNSMSKRIVISENGETLESLRRKWPAFNNINIDGPYDEFDFLKDLSIIEHGMYYLARGLTAVASAMGSEKAIKSMNKNLNCIQKTNK